MSNRDLRRPSSPFVCADSPLKGNRDESGPPGSAGVPPACCPVACRSVSLRCGSPARLPVEIAWARAEAEPWRHCRSTRVEKMGEALPVWCGRDARAPGGASSHDVVEPMEVYPSSCLFVFIGGSSSFNNPVHPVHPCSIHSPSRLIFPVAGLGCAQRPDSHSASRAAASGPFNPVPWVAARFPCDPAPVHRAGGNRMGPAQAEPGRLCRSIRVVEMGEALPVWCGRDARAPGGLSPLTP